jgi:hypothetical protein
MSAARIFILSTLAVACVALGTVAALNAYVDPSMQYRMPSYQARYSSGYSRQINAGLARHLRYDAVIVGSSYTMNFRNSDFDRQFGGRTVSMAMPGMFVSEGRKAIDYAATQRRLGHVYFGVDFYAFDEAKNKYEFPGYLYDDALLNDSPYLLSVDTTKRSLNVLLGRGVGSFNTDPDSPWSWATRGPPAAPNAALADYVNQPSGAAGVILPSARMREEATHQIGQLLQQHPATIFEFFLPPYSALTWMANAEAGNLDPLLAFRIHVARIIERYPNGRLHDFQSMPDLICNLDHYVDMGHYGPADSRALVSAMHDGTYLATPQIVEANNQALRKTVDSRCSGTVPSRAALQRPGAAKEAS